MVDSGLKVQPVLFSNYVRAKSRERDCSAFITTCAYADSVRKFQPRKLTLKALANSSPGFALKPWVQNAARDFIATLKELRLLCGLQTATQPFQGCIFKNFGMRSQGFKANPGLEFANAFSVSFLGWNFANAIGVFPGVDGPPSSVAL